MDQPTRIDYVRLIYTLFAQFEQQGVATKRGRPFTYQDKVLIVFFMLMQFYRIFQFKAQQRWLQTHPAVCSELGFASVPHRTTLSRRYKQLYTTVQAFVAFTGQSARTLDAAFSSATLVEDKSLFKARGPVWHQRDRAAGRLPHKLRNLDPDATWAKSGYQGWVYGYGLHMTCTAGAFPTVVHVETGATSESSVIDQKAAYIFEHLVPQALAADDRYTQATRIRAWAKHGTALLTPALRWVKSRYACAYHQFIKEPRNAHMLRQRRTTIEPLFDLLAKVLGTTGKPKQLAVQRLGNVRTCLALATLTVQLAMIVNSMWGLPLRNISTMMAACT